MGTRLDKALMARGLCSSRSKAQAAIAAGQVMVNEVVITAASRLVVDDDVLAVVSPCPYVSRGGLKLEGALRESGVSAEGRVCLDIGASTGGFTDCLLQHGAQHVVAIDVGTAQLAASLKSNPQVSSYEQTHARDLPNLSLTALPTLVVVDVSFISILKVLPYLLAFYEKKGTLLEEARSEMASPAAAPATIIDGLFLLKPQFEFGEVYPGKSFDGVVRDETQRQAIIDTISNHIQNLSPCFTLLNRFDAVIHGPKGNREVFLQGQFKLQV